MLFNSGFAIRKDNNIAHKWAPTLSLHNSTFALARPRQLLYHALLVGL